VNFKVAFVSAALGIIASAPAMSQEAGWYLGGALGRAEARQGCEGVTVSCDDTDTGWKIFGGYQINRNFGVELGYADFGENTASGVISGVAVNATAEMTAWDLVGVASIPFGGRFAAYGKLGFYRGDVEVRATASVPGFSATAQADDQNTDVTFGFGLKLDISRNLAVRAEWQRYNNVGGSDTGESDIDLLSIGLLYRF